MILDSGLIYRYLVDKLGQTPLSWDQQNTLASIDSVNDALVNMFILERSDIDNTADKMYFNIQRERASKVFAHLDELAEKGHFSIWNYLSICLYCLLDWSAFRARYDFSQHAALMAFYTENRVRESVV